MLNFVDYAVLALLLYFIWQGYRTGFIGGIFNAIGIALSFAAALVFYPQVGSFINDIFGWGDNVSLVAAFFLILIGIEILMSFLFNYISSLTSPIYRKNITWRKIDKVLGIVPSVLVGMFLVSIFLLIPLILPVKKNISEPVTQSYWGSNVVVKFLTFQPQIESVLSRLPYKNLAYIVTPQPLSKDSVQVEIPQEIKLESDPKAEKEMFDLVNRERTNRGLPAVVWGDSLRDNGRKHCLDMFSRGYFSHYTPEGLSPFDRMDRDQIDYVAAGENLAYAPNVAVAHQGLMNSPGHRENILREEFGTLGVGVIDGGLHGQMYCQEFTD